MNGKIAPIVVGSLVTTAFALILCLLILRPINLDAQIADILKIMIGTLGAKFGDVVQYFIGSSSGSKSKEDILREAVNQQK